MGAWPAPHPHLVAWESAEHPRSVSIGLVGGPCGMDDLADIDGTEPGPRAKVVSLGDMLQALLEAAELGWFTPEDEVDVIER